MKKIYLDNAATSFPKAPGTSEFISDYINNIGASINRGIYSSSTYAEEVTLNTRELLCSLFNFKNPNNVVFTKNITESLNVLIKGLISPNDHVIVSSMEHNAVMRPLNSLVNKGIEVSKVYCNSLGELCLNSLENLIKPNTKAIIMLHASNVCGTILPLEKVGLICKKHNLFFIVDTAQTAGFLDIDMNKLNANAIAFTGHKSLLGPQGIGGFLIDKELNNVISPLIEGGTGSLSEEETQPKYMPDKFEGGTPNTVGIFGLNNSLNYIKNCGLESIRDKELFLTQLFLNDVLNIKDIEVIGYKNILNRTPVVSINIKNKDIGEIGFYLDRDFGIMTRIGLHCAPSAHKTLGTFPNGTIRFSFSSFNTKDEIKYSVHALNKIINTYF